MNKDFRVSVGLFHHPKTKKLHRRLGADGVLALLRLWGFAAQYRFDGNLVGLGADDIAAAADWEGQADELLGVLSDCGFMEDHGGRWVIHDWVDHNGWAAKFPERSRRGRENASRRWNNMDGGRMGPANGSDAMNVAIAHADHASGNAPSPVPSPAPTPKPVPTSSSGSQDQVRDDVETVVEHLDTVTFEGDMEEARQGVTDLLRQGYSAREVMAGITLGAERAEKAGSSPRSLNYFRAAIQEVREAGDGYAAHVLSHGHQQDSPASPGTGGGGRDDA